MSWSQPGFHGDSWGGGLARLLYPQRSACLGFAAWSLGERAAGMAWCMGRLSSLMTSLLDTHEQVPGCWTTSSTVAVSARALRGRGHASVLPSVTVSADDVVGTWLADAAHAESVSWMALRAVERELLAHDAPEPLARGARRIAAAALHNAAVLESMALRWGVRPRQPKVVSIAVRPLDALAAENAGQGCVRETWAALEAQYQSLYARDPVIRRTMRRIATDGLRHAEFSWSVDSWVATPRTAGSRPCRPSASAGGRRRARSPVRRARALPVHRGRSADGGDGPRSRPGSCRSALVPSSRELSPQRRSTAVTWP